MSYGHPAAQHQNDVQFHEVFVHHVTKACLVNTPPSKICENRATPPRYDSQCLDAGATLARKACRSVGEHQRGAGVKRELQGHEQERVVDDSCRSAVNIGLPPKTAETHTPSITSLSRSARVRRSKSCL